MESMVWLTLNLRDSSWPMGNFAAVEVEVESMSWVLSKSISSQAQDCQANEHGSTQRPLSFPFTSPYFFLLPLFLPGLDAQLKECEYLRTYLRSNYI